MTFTNDMIRQDINTLTSLFPRQVKTDGAGLWAGHALPSLPRLLFLCWPDSICSLIDPEGVSHW